MRHDRLEQHYKELHQRAEDLRKENAALRAEQAALRERNERQASALRTTRELAKTLEDDSRQARALLAEWVKLVEPDDALEEQTHAFLDPRRDEAPLCKVCGTPVEKFDGLCHRTHLVEPARDEAPRLRLNLPEGWNIPSGASEDAAPEWDGAMELRMNHHLIANVGKDEVHCARCEKTFSWTAIRRDPASQGICQGAAPPEPGRGDE